MGPENSDSVFTVYIDGKPAQYIGTAMPDFSAGGVSAEEDGVALATASTAWENLSMTIEVAAEDIRKFFNAAELAMAVWLARIFEPAMAHRYLHTKKKRIRKKYEKRIRAWFREVLR